MSTTPAQPESQGAHSREIAPMVVVRAEKYFLCTVCGTLVEIPADVVGQLTWGIQQPPPSEHADESPAQTEQPQDLPAGDKRPPKRPARLEHPTYHGTLIDGLTVPTGQQLDRALAWVSYHLKLLDRQESELKQLKKLLKKHAPRKAPCSRPPAHAKQQQPQSPPRHQPCQEQRHRHTSPGMNMPSDANGPAERGPP